MLDRSVCACGGRRFRAGAQSESTLHRLSSIVIYTVKASVLQLAALAVSHTSHELQVGRRLSGNHSLPVWEEREGRKGRGGKGIGVRGGEWREGGCQNDLLSCIDITRDC